MLQVLTQVKMKKLTWMTCNMKTKFVKIEDIINDVVKCPLPIEVIPNHMGINLCSVEAISWTKQDDGQLTDLTIHFLPAAE